VKTIFSKKTDQFILVAKVTPDKMKLFIDVEPANCGNLTKDELMAVINEFSGKAEIHAGVIEDAVKLLRRGEKITERRIAKGTPAETGADGKLLLLVKKLSDKASVKIDEKGFADYHELHLFDNILVGQAVARIYPPKPGVPGKDVMGDALKPTPGKPAKFTVDKTLLVEPPKDAEFQIVTAQIDGYLEEDNGKLVIKPQLLIKGDLDLHTGNINFIGSVKVQGDVMPNMSIQARQGIEIAGSVQSATLISPEGDIVVKGHFFGGERSKVIGGKGFQASVVQEVNVEVRGDIRVDKESTDSVLRTQSTLFLPRGRFIGGAAYVVCGAEALEWGNASEKATKIYLCSDVEVRGDFTKLLQLIADHERAAELIKLHLGPYATNPARIQLLQAPHRQKMEKFLVKLKEVEAGKVKLLAQKQELLEQAKSNHVPRVNVLGVLHPGTILYCGKQTLEIKEEKKGPLSFDYHPETEKFESGELKPVECAIDLPKGAEGEKNEQGKDSEQK
jgi:uncharacterized protein (DUF342 family)